jgi:hypothetical protein
MDDVDDMDGMENRESKIESREWKKSFTL